MVNNQTPQQMMELTEKIIIESINDSLININYIKSYLENLSKIEITYALTTSGYTTYHDTCLVKRETNDLDYDVILFLTTVYLKLNMYNVYENLKKVLIDSFSTLYESDVIKSTIDVLDKEKKLDQFLITGLIIRLNIYKINNYVNNIIRNKNE